MKRIYLNEENLPPKLPVSFSTKINNNINLIKDYNQNNLDALSKWYDYIDNLKSYISHRKIAWDYVNRYAHFPNGAVHLVELGYDVYFIVKTNNTTQTNYVYVFKLNLKPKEFGLNIPPTLKENKIQNSYNTMKNKKVIRLTESDLHMLIEEAVKNVLNEVKVQCADGQIRSLHGHNNSLSNGNTQYGAKAWNQMSKLRKQRANQYTKYSPEWERNMDAKERNADNAVDADLDNLNRFNQNLKPYLYQ